MNWYRDLFVGETFQKKKRQVIRLVEKGKPMRGLTLLIVRKEACGSQLEILAQEEFIRQREMLEPLMIVGIAFGAKEADDLLVKITQEVVRETQTASIRDYFLTHS